MIKTVFADANVLIAAAASRTGASHAVLLLAEMGMIKLVVSRQVLDEADRNLRRKLPDGLPVLAEWLTYIDPIVLPDPHPNEYERWFSIIEKKDAPILETAVQASVDFLVTLNTKDFTAEVTEATNLFIQTPAEIVRNVRLILVRNL
jgi:predicted nucleic acid-binding protein